MTSEITQPKKKCICKFRLNQKLTTKLNTKIRMQNMYLKPQDMQVSTNTYMEIARHAAVKYTASFWVSYKLQDCTYNNGTV